MNNQLEERKPAKQLAMSLILMIMLKRLTSNSAIAFVFLTLSFSAIGSEYSSPLTPYGHPDIQGNWTSDTITPFVRPAELGEKNPIPKRKLLN
jgi:hypothetical protein